MTVVAFDFDGTLSDSEMTVLLGDQCGVAGEMEAITERAMNDELSYAASLRSRCELLEDLPLEKAQAAFDQVRLRPGAAAVLRSLRDAGVYTAILTGGFERGVRAALDHAGVEVDAIVSNRLVDDGDALTGAVEGPLIEGTKDDALAALADERGVALAETIAVGDGANDLPMLAVAGLAVGFQPKPAVAPSCDVIVETMTELQGLFEENGTLT